MRVNISLPDELHRRAREAHLNISQLAQSAVAEALDRLDKAADLDRHLRLLDSELGPQSPEQERRADQWLDRVFGKSGEREVPA